MTSLIDGEPSLRGGESIPPTRREITRAHASYHEVNPNTLLEPEVAVRLGAVLCRSEDSSFQLDSGCASLEAAFVTGEGSHLDHAAKVLKKLEKNAPDLDTRLRAKLYRAYVPAFRESLEGKTASPNFMMERVVEVNSKLLHDVRRTGEEVPQLAASVGLLYVLLRDAAKNPRPGNFASPSMPRQREPKAKGIPFIPSFDVATGQVLAPLLKFKVFPAMKAGHPDIRHRYDFERSRRDPNILLIYGDLHLGNTSKDRYRLNKVIGEDKGLSREVALDLVTQNVLEEIGTTVVV